MTETPHDLSSPSRVPQEGLRLDPPLSPEPFGSAGSLAWPPRLSGGAAYFMLRDGSIDARDLAGGGSLWRRRVGGKIDRERTRDGFMLISDDALLTQFGDELLVVDRGSGDVRTRARLPGCTLAGAVASGTSLYAVEVSEDLSSACVCWDFERSQLRWRVSIAGPTALTLSGSTLLLAPDGEECLALQAPDGRALWRCSVADLGLEGAGQGVPRTSIPGPIMIAHGHAFFGVVARHVVALDVATGRSIWTRRVGVEAPLRLRVHGGDAYLLDATLFYRLDAATGRVKLEVPVEEALAAADIRMPTQPAVTDRFLYFGDVLSGALGALDMTQGELSWSFTCRAPIPVSFAPVVGKGRMFVVDREGNLYVFRQS